ncbi:MAG: WXG100 family type VII secretion target [Anaerolineae bacterium]|jgi:WXG100 family type VII secretion target|nr:WXG100 family type VII secretion target [Anaerolineae bacterium]
MGHEIIQINYEETETIAKIFTSEHDRMNRVYTDLKRCVDQLRNGWVSEGADAFFAEMDDEVLPKVKRLVEALSIAHDQIMQIHEVMSTSEDQCTRSFQDILHEPLQTLKLIRDRFDRKQQDGTPTPPNPLTGWQLDAYNEAVSQGVDPVLAMMLIQNERNNRGFEDSLDYGFMYNILNARTFGIAQVATTTASDMITLYPELLEGFDDQKDKIFNDDGTINQYELGYLLYSDQSFSARIAVAYIRHLETRIYDDLNQFGVVVSDEPIEGQVTMTTTQVRDLIIMSYNTGWEGFSSNLQINDGPEDVVERLVDTIIIHKTHVDNVNGLETEIEDLIGQQLESPPETDPSDDRN